MRRKMRREKEDGLLSHVTLDVSQKENRLNCLMTEKGGGKMRTLTTF